MNKKIFFMPYLLSLMLALLLLLPSAYAVADDSMPAGPTVAEMAQALKELGLFKGSAYGLELDKPCDRLMGAVIMVRLLGKEQEALSANYQHPFVDVAGSYASPYIGYLYQSGLANGLSPTAYGRNNMTGQQLAALLLRALGYQDGVDFAWQTALQSMNSLGILPNAELAKLQTGQFLREQAALLCYRALLATPKNEEQSLVWRLLWEDVFTTNQLAKTHDAALLLAADMPDAMTFLVRVYTEQQFRDILWLSLRNRQANLFISSPWLSQQRAQQIVDELTRPYFIRDFLVTLSVWDNQTFLLSSYIGEYMAMQFYYENPGRYAKNFQFYEQQYRQPLGDYFSMYVWQETVDMALSQLIREDMSEYERLKSLHDYLAGYIEYDYEAAAAVERGETDNPGPSHFAQGVFYYGKAVCDGYASALKLLLNGTGIECRVIYGAAFQQAHAWNQVKINGQWYNVDVTAAATAGGEDIYYGYFCAPDNIFLRDHTPEKEGIAQPCTAIDLYQML